jgi:hypothetical protein
VKPVLHPGQTSTEVYLPGQEPWYDVDTFVGYMPHGGNSLTVETPIDKMPVFQRGGSIIPRQLRVRRSSSLMRQDPYTLFIALDTHGEAFGELYLDDGHSFDYQQGFFRSHLLMSPLILSLSLSLSLPFSFLLEGCHVCPMFGNGIFVSWAICCCFVSCLVCLCLCFCVGNYARRQFTFANGRLFASASTLKPVGNLSVGNTIERVVMMGLKTPPTSIAFEGSNTAIDFEFHPERKVLVIRKPDVKVVDDWSIIFS